MRREVTSHIRQAANQYAVNTNGQTSSKEIVIGDIGCFAAEVAAIARACRIPDSEVLHEGVGQASGAYRRKSSCMPDIEICAAYGPSYMKQKQHRQWYHMGQNYHHAAALVHSTSIQQQQHITHVQSQLQQQLLLKDQQGTLRPSRAADQPLQSFGSSSSSNASSGIVSSRSSGSSPGGLPALPRLQPVTSNISSAGAAGMSDGGSSSDEDLLRGFQAEFDSESAGCIPTYAGDEVCLGMLLGTTFGL